MKNIIIPNSKFVLQLNPIFKKKWNVHFNHKHNCFNLYYWRERSDEVDFVMEKGGKVIALEVKTNPARQTKGMAAFTKQWQPHKILMIGKEGLSWQDFLTTRVNDLFQ